MPSYIRGKQLRDLIHLSESNLKRYYELLELHGYSFARNSRGHRIYNEDDIKVFQAIIHLNKEKNMSLDEAASLVCSKDVDMDSILTDSKTDSQNHQKLPSVTGVSVELPSEMTVKMLVELHEMQLLYQTSLEQLHKENAELKQQVIDLEKKITERDQGISQTLEKVNQQAILVTTNMDKHYKQLQQEQFEQFQRLKQQKKGFFARILRSFKK